MITNEKIIKTAEEAFTMAEAADKLSMPHVSFRRRALELGVYKPNIGRKGRVGSHNKKPLAEILDGLHPNYKATKVRHRLIKEGVKKDECEKCGWHEKRSGDEYSGCMIHHKDGDDTNHRIENLEMLCPNCHRLTPTWGKVKKYFAGIDELV